MFGCLGTCWFESNLEQTLEAVETTAVYTNVLAQVVPKILSNIHRAFLIVCAGNPKLQVWRLKF
jgi:(2Fe-2S) ferredoxin